MAQAHVKRDDVVVVLSGEHKGQSGRIVKVDHEKQRVTVEGVNVRRCATRRSMANPQGGLAPKECPIHMSKVMRQDKYESRQQNRKQAEPGQ